jgi:Rieske Fe-S protein
VEGAQVPRLSRRGVIIACAGAAGGAALTTSCDPAGPVGGGPAGGPGGGAGTPGSPVTVRAAEIPVGGGTVFDSGVVVTQPKAGEFEAFSAICTHAQCFVTAVQGGAIHCPCHGSRFSVTDGSVLTGPALQPLPRRTVTVNGDSLTVS